MNTASTFNNSMQNTETDTDYTFPYVLLSSLSGALVSLAAVWISTAAVFGPMVGA
jgi:hypothetical protein